MNWYLKVLKDYVNFNGRARRKEYWMFVLFNVIFGIVAQILDRMFGTTYGTVSSIGTQSGYIYTLYTLAVFLPALAVTVRRLHDIGKSGWWFLIVFTIIGIIWLIVLTIMNGDQGENAYGPDPKNAEASTITDKTILDSNVNA